MDNIKSIISNNEGQRNYNFLPPSVIPATYIKGKKGNTPITMEGIQYPMIGIDKYGVNFQQPDQQYNYKSKGVLEFPFMPGSTKKDEEMNKAQQGGSQDQQIQQLIAAYAQLKGVDPQEIVKQLQSLPKNQQQQALQSIAQEVQQAMAQQQQQQQMAMQQQGAGPEQQEAMMGQQDQEGPAEQEQEMQGQGMMEEGGEPCFGCYDHYNPSPQAQDLNWFYKKEGGPFSAANTYPTDWASYSGNQYAKGGTSFPAAVKLQDWFGGDRSFMFAEGGNTSDQWGGQSDIHRAYKMMKEGGFAMNPKKKKGGKFNHLDAFNEYLQKGGGLKKYQYDGTVVRDETDYDPEFSKVIDWMMNYEQQGSAAGPNGYVGGGRNWGTNRDDLADREKAKRYYYDNYWSKVKDLPPGLRTRALQLAVNTGDPYGELMVASGKMSVADRANTKNDRKDKSPSEFKGKEWANNQDAIIAAYEKDPEKFLQALDAEQNRYYNQGLQGMTDEQRKFLTGYYQGVSPFANDYYNISTSPEGEITTSSPKSYEFENSSGERYEYLPLRQLQDWARDQGLDAAGLSRQQLQNAYKNYRQKQASDFENQSTSQSAATNTQAPATSNQPAPNTTTSTNSDEARRYVEGIGWVSPAFENEYCIDEKCSNLQGYFGTDKTEEEWKDYINKYQKEIEPNYSYDYTKDHSPIYLTNPETGEKTDIDINRYMQDGEFISDMIARNDLIENRLSKELGEAQKSGNTAEINRIQKELMDIQHQGHTISGEGLGIYPDWKARKNETYDYFSNPQNQPSTYLNGVSSPYGVALANTPANASQPPASTDQSAQTTTKPPVNIANNGWYSQRMAYPETNLYPIGDEYISYNGNQAEIGDTNEDQSERTDPFFNNINPTDKDNQYVPTLSLPYNDWNSNLNKQSTPVPPPGNDKINQEDYNAYTSYGDAGTPNAYDNSTNLQGYNSRFETPGFNPFAYRNADKAERHWQRGEQENNHRGKGWREFRQMKQEEDIAQMQADKDFNSGAYRNQNRALRQYNHGFANSGKGWKDYREANSEPKKSNMFDRKMLPKVDQYVGNLPSAGKLGVKFWDNKNIRKIKGTPDRPMLNIGWNTPGAAYTQGAMNSKLFGSSGLGMALSTLTGALDPKAALLGESSPFKAKYRRDGSLRKVKGSTSDVNAFFNPNAGTTNNSTTTNNTGTTSNTSGASTSSDGTSAPMGFGSSFFNNRWNNKTLNFDRLDPTMTNDIERMRRERGFAHGGAYHYLPMALMGIPPIDDSLEGSPSYQYGDNPGIQTALGDQDRKANAYGVDGSTQPKAPEGNVKVKTTDKGAWWQPNEKRVKGLTALLASGNAVLDAKAANRKQDQYTAMQENMTTMSNPAFNTGNATQTQFNSPGSPENDRQKVFPNGPGANIPTGANYGINQLYNTSFAQLPSTRDGGSIYDKYEDGGEYDLTDEEIQEILAAGGSIEYI